MSGDVTAEFFEAVQKRGQVPFLRNVSGTLRFDIVEDGQARPWYVTITSGSVQVSRQDADADTVVRVRKEIFDGIASGTVNAMAAVLRGTVMPSGNLRLLMAFGRFFPGPPASPAAAGARHGR